MSKTIQAIRGMNDILPADISTWQFVEAILRRLTAQYGYQEIRLPVVEVTQLFKRTIGEVTDIVEKEMYEFEDRNGDSICMRPEGTAGCVRAGIQHGLLYNQTPKLWYSGPMYRYERPQKGRYRQFYQFGLEAFGVATPDIDAELIAFTAALWRELGLTAHLSLQINSLGTRDVRAKHREALVAYYSDHQHQLDEDSQRRLTTNPLRILDSKNPDMTALNDEAPKLLDYLDEASQEHFNRLCELLDELGINYHVNPCLVRGLDYYTKTVFEWVTTELGAQGTVCAGGRFDGLVEQLGGKATPAIGLSMGLERLILLLQEQACVTETAVADAYLILAGDEAQRKGMKIAEELRHALPQLQVQTNLGGGSLKSQFKRADKSGAKLALVLGDDELAKQQLAVKFLREEREQAMVPMAELIDFIDKAI